MLSSRVNRIVVALLLVISCLPPAAHAGTWMCEGKTCGTTWGRCCCTGTASRHPRCTQPASTSQASLCASGCACVMVVCDAPSPPYMSPGSLSLPLPDFGLPAPHMHSILPMVTEAALPLAPTRGPPSASVCLATPSLRAPPAA